MVVFGSVTLLLTCHQLADLELRAFMTSELRHLPEVWDGKALVLTASHVPGCGCLASWGLKEWAENQLGG